MIKTGIIGDRSFCSESLDKLVDIQELRMIGYHQVKSDNTDYLSDKFNIRPYCSTNELLGDVDAVIAMPPFSSPDNVSFFVRNSKHVFFELSTDYSKSVAGKLSAIIDEANVKVQVGFHHRFNNTFLAAKPFVVRPKFIQSGNYKKVVTCTENTKMLLDMLINDVDIVLSVVNSEVKNVVANAASVLPGTPDVINVRIEFHNGCVAQLTAGLIATEDTHQFGFYCDRDFINIDLNRNKAWLIRKKSQEGEMRLFQENIGDLCVEEISVKPNNYLFDEFNSFAKSIVYDRHPEVSVESTVKTLSVIQMIKDRIKLSAEL